MYLHQETIVELKKPNPIKRLFTRKRNLNRTIWGDLGLFILLLGFGFFSAYPLIMTVSNSFKPLDELFYSHKTTTKKHYFWEL